MDRKPGSGEHVEVRRQTAAEPTLGLRGPSKELVDSKIPGADSNWQGSSFDLAQGLDVKEMVSKLSSETLDRLFRS